MERAAKTLANSVPRESSHTSLLRKVYDAVVPSAEADVVGIIYHGFFFAINTCLAIGMYYGAILEAHEGTVCGAIFITAGLLGTVGATMNAYMMIQEWNDLQPQAQSLPARH